jgi:uncharacterized protein (TIGR03000 family)
MYSVVLMMALSGSAEVPAWHGCRGCHGGCYGGGYGGCYGGGGCFGGWGGGCHGRGHGFFGHRRHGCNGGCYGSGHGCWGGGYGSGCWGGYGGGYGGGCWGGYGGGYGGCWGGYGGGYGGCWGGGVQYGAPAAQPAPTTAPATEQAPTPKTGLLRAPATIVVSLPVDAKLTIDDMPTKSTAATRVFSSPALEPGKEYFYTLKAELTQDGQKVSTTKRVSVRAGQESRVTLAFSGESVASR